MISLIERERSVVDLIETEFRAIFFIYFWRKSDHFVPGLHRERRDEEKREKEKNKRERRERERKKKGERKTQLEEKQ